MKIKSLHLTTATDFSLHCVPSLPICILCGRQSETVLQLMGALLHQSDTHPLRLGGQAILHADVLLDGEEYALCYLRDSVNGDRIAVHFEKGSRSFSQRDTERYLARCIAKNTDGTNFLDGNDSLPAPDLLSESDRLVELLLRFIRQAAATADDRPLFISNLLDRIDAATDLHPLFQALAQTGRQVFFSVGPSYKPLQPDPLVQLVYTDPSDAPHPPEGFEADYTPLPCPVCGVQTLSNHWICPSCGWEYDGLSEDHYSAANGTTLREYRALYRKENA